MKRIAILIMISLSLILISCSNGVTYREEYDKTYVQTTASNENKFSLFSWENSVTLSKADEDTTLNLNNGMDTSWFKDKSIKEVYDKMYEEGYILMNIGNPNYVKTYNNYKINLDIGYKYTDLSDVSFSLSNNEYKVLVEFGKPKEKNPVVSLKYVYELEEPKGVLVKGIQGLGSDWKSLTISY